jgi:hypothetical protein
MLAITLPYVAQWNSWHSSFGNEVSGLRPLLEQIDAACATAGRGLGEVEKTVAAYIQLPGGTGRMTGRGVIETDTAHTGSREDLAYLLREYADAGVGHVQLVLDPIDSSTVEEMGEVLRLID